MSKSLSTLETPETSLTDRRRTSLATVCRRLNSHFVRGFLEYIETGFDLALIDEGELYLEAGQKSFNEFIQVEYGGMVTESGPLTVADARKRIHIAKIYNEIRAYLPSVTAIRQAVKAQHPDLDEQELDDQILKGWMPTSQKLLKELLAYPLLQAAQTYTKFIIQAKRSGQPITGQALKDFRANPGIMAIEIETVSTPMVREPLAIRDQQNGDQNDGDPDWGRTDDVLDLKEEPEPTPLRTVAATATLDRIEKFSSHLEGGEPGRFPRNARQIIEQQHLLISDQELEMWNNYSDEDFLKIGLLLFMEDPEVPRLMFTNAYRFLGQMKRIIAEPAKSKASLNDLIYMAIAHRGFAKFGYGNFQITVIPRLTAIEA